MRWDRDVGRWFAFMLVACAVACFNVVALPAAGHRQQHGDVQGSPTKTASSQLT
jgi:hypothetical protein